MGFKLVMILLSILIFSSSTYANARRELLSDGGEFDVTSAKYGGKADSDISQALANAWKDACASTSPSKVIVPKGTYKVKEAEFKGPCKAPIEIQVQGTLQAPEDATQLTKPDTWIGFLYIDDFTLSGGGTFDGQGSKSWKANDCQKNPKCSGTINLRFHAIKKSTVKDITSLNSKNFHINVISCEQLTFDHVTITAPGDSPNTDGIHIGRSTGVNITDSTIGTGDDCISIGDGTKQLTITKVTCGPGHGISVGSLGKYDKEDPVEGINVKNCTLSKTTNGVRVKTWPNSPSPGTATDIHFEDIIMDNVQNPVVVDQEYCPWNQCDKSASSKIKISNVSFKNIRGTSATALAVKVACAKANPCDKVELTDIDLKFTGQGQLTSQCTNTKPTISNVAKPLACATDAPVAAGQQTPAQESSSD
ncbi:exopolygalacturonase-like [Argentina anserina]|uniref:exopolygalacturonase-like n=1 Tax=Argentina anserina TaxID=57926 RepID=UPI0021768ACE|nr:exopolygalacturonase-like [Potentilla anserina]